MSKRGGLTLRRFGVVLALLALGAGACAEGAGGGSGTTHTQIYLTDDPFPFDSIARVDVYIVKVEVSASLDTSLQGTQDWVTVAEPLRTFNLLDYQGGASVLAGEADIPAGEYQAIRVVIDAGQSRVVANSGAEVPVQWPVPGELALHAYVEHALEVSGGNARIVIDFDVGRSFLVLESFPPRFAFSPWIRAVNEAATGTIAGVVTGPDIEGNQTPLPDVGVLVLTTGAPGVAGAIVATGRTDAAGRYTVGFLSAGQYGVAPQPPAFYGFRGAVATVQVGAGTQTVASFALVRDTTGGPGPDTTGTPGGPVASVAIRIGTPSGSASLVTCDSLPLTAELRNAAGQVLSGRVVSWSTSSPAVLALEGVFGHFAHARALSAGSSFVTAASEGRSATTQFTVVAGPPCTGGGGGPPVPVDTVRISPSAITAAVNDSIGAYANLVGSSGQVITGRLVTFSVSDTSVVRITGVFGQSVLMRAIGVGNATLTATSEGRTGTAAITVR